MLSPLYALLLLRPCKSRQFIERKKITFSGKHRILASREIYVVSESTFVMKGDTTGQGVVPLRTILRNILNLIDSFETRYKEGLDSYDTEFQVCSIIVLNNIYWVDDEGLITFSCFPMIYILSTR